MNRENEPLVTDELVEFNQQPLQVSRRQTNCVALHKNLDNIPQINQGKLQGPYLKTLHSDAISKKCDRQTRPSTHPQNRQT